MAGKSVKNKSKYNALKKKGIDVNETVEVSAVQVPVLVTGPDGRFIRGLKPKDFIVVEDGRRQTVETLIVRRLLHGRGRLGSLRRLRLRRSATQQNDCQRKNGPHRLSRSSD